MAGVITASESSWTAPFTGLSPRRFAKLVTVLRRAGVNHQVVVDADTRLVVVVGQPLPGNRNDCKAWGESGAKAAVGHTTTIADGGYPGTGLVMPHLRRAGEELAEWKQEHNRSHKQVRARVEHAFAHLKTWKILRDCRLKGDGVHHAMLGIAHLAWQLGHRAIIAWGRFSPPVRDRQEMRNAAVYWPAVRS